MLKYKGAWSAYQEYEKGDCVVYVDDVAYHLINKAPIGADCHNSMYWERVSQPINEVILMFHSSFEDIFAGLSNIPTNIGESSIVLKSTDETSTNEYLITIDESGEEPEVVATLIENEAESEPESAPEGDDT